MTAGAVAEVLEVPGLSAYVETVETALEDAVGWASGTVVAGAGSDTLRSGGKRLRPMLVYLTAPVAGRGRPGLVAAGCAVELVHMATLVHDDQLDAARLRRGRPTVWAAHGEAVARCTGDYLFARAFAVLCATGDMAAVTLLSEACLALARGEILQREQTGNPATTPEQYLERCRLKTGRLFAAAAMLGGRLGGMAGADVERLGEFATALGLAFQIADDILDCDGRPDTTGKPLGTDLLDGTVTLPLILGARRDPAVAGVIARGAAPEDVLPTLARVARAGAVREARAVAERHADVALAHLDALDGGLDSAALRAVVRGAVDRDA
ncbi:MAG TPA: polyprenyl synthetase family protein [Gaiellales bacterium]|jgi:geranylgeranyl pyrophosphate synthase